MKRCPACGEENPARAKFCLACATPLPDTAAPAREVRKVVTLVFADVTGSTALGEQLDPESLRRVMSRYFDEMQAVIERHGGTVEKFVGDAVMAVFGIPVLHEDDALRSVRAAVEMRDALARLNADLTAERGVEIAVRTGVNTGEVVAGDAGSGQRFATGDAVNVAARLEQAAAPGEILLGETTYRLVRDAVDVEPLEPLPLKGKSAAVPAYRLRSVSSAALGRARRLDSPLVGRTRERKLLFDAFERTLAERACQLFTVLGAAGVGKSRLAAEFLDGLGTQAQVIRGRCLSYGEGITYWPLEEALKGLLAEDEDSREALLDRVGVLLADEHDADVVRARLAGLLGSGEAVASAEEGAWAVRRIFEAAAHRRPLVAVFDDIHWAEPTFLDLVEHVADWSRDAPILLLCLARPELLDARRGWGGDKFNATTVLLEPLGAPDAAALIENLLDGATLPDDVRDRVVTAAEGNPLFVEELVGMLVDDGLVEQQNGGWTATGDLSQLAVPPTIQALLAARLDRLGDAERTLAEAGAVEGKVFHGAAARELVPPERRGDAGSALLGLVRRDLVRPDRAAFAGEDAFRFRHQLIRDAAYEALPKDTRAELHERFVAWLEERRHAHDEIVGYHLEQAARYRRELSPLDPRADELAASASDRLAAAGRAAAGRGDSGAAAGLLGRAAGLAPDGAARAELLYERARALASHGAQVEAGEVQRQAVVAARALGDRALELRAAIRAEVALSRTDPSWTADALNAAVADAVREFGDAARHDVLADAYHGLADVHLERCRWESCAAALEQAIGHARSAGDRVATAQMLADLANALYWGPTPVDEAIARCEAIRAEVHEIGLAIAEAHTVYYLAGLEAMRGRFDEMRALIRHGRRLFRERGAPQGIAAKALVSGPSEALAGDPEAAERNLREACDYLEKIGETGVYSTVAGDLALVLCEQERWDEAWKAVGASERTTSRDDLASLILIGAAKGRVLAARGALDEAEEQARHAVELAETTDFLTMHGDALLALGSVLVSAGRAAEARDAYGHAAGLFEHKGNVVAAERARQAAAALAAPA